MKVKPIPPYVVNKIYAGEVIQSPSSVVKELLENSLDAGASSISLFVRGSGLSFIKVSDNGEGISKEDLPNVIKKNWSSKIHELDDLERIETFGFRGEALHAIASVSRMHIRSSIDGNMGYEIYVEGGNLMDMRPCACGKGTTVIVEDLFFNIPVRRRFISSSKAESSRIKDVWLNYVLANEHVEFHYRSSNKIHHYVARENRDERIEDVFGVENKKELMEDDLRIVLYRINGRSQRVFVNRRPVVDNRISEILGRYDIKNYILFIEVPPSMVDVNVHPQKLQVRFSRSLKFYDRFSRFVRSGTKSVVRVERSLFETQKEEEKEEERKPKLFVWRDYIVVPSKNKLTFIHRKRALKRIYEEFISGKKKLKSRQYPVPIPLRIRFSESDINLLKAYGFDIVKIEGNLVIRGIPEILENPSQEAIMDILASFADRNSAFDLRRFVGRLVHFAAEFSKMAPEMIVNRLLSLENPALTSDGEVIIFDMDASRIDEKFL